MATALVPINKNTYTQVLSGAGFAFAESPVEYLFAASQPSGDGMSLKIGQQITGTTGQTLWAKSVGFDTSVVFSNPEGA